MQSIKKLHKLQSVGFNQATRTIIKSILLGKAFTLFEKFGLHVLPVHFYSPVPDTRELRKNLGQWYREGSFVGVNFDLEEEKKLLDKLLIYKEECIGLASYEQVDKQGFGEGFGEVEAHILHAMIRHLKPHNIVEIGSGCSTFFSVNALSINKEKNKIDSKIVCIEPYPRPALSKIRGNCQIEIVPKPVQDVSPDFFNNILGKGDILFIDSSHIVKINSDVNYLYLEVLPRLREGVIIHIHDIPFPRPTPNPDHWIFGKHHFWTEAALVQAFLTHNYYFKILLCSSYLHCKAPDALSSVFTIYDPQRHFPSSLWLQKIR